LNFNNAGINDVMQGLLNGTGLTYKLAA